MATLFVDKLDPQSGTALEIGTSGDTITIPSGATIVNSGTATGFGGITVVDLWRLSAVAIGSHDPLSANWERADTDGAGVVGSGMTESSGVFTFPSTGIWRIEFLCYMYLNGDNRGITCDLETATDGTTFDRAASAAVFIQQTSGSNTYNGGYCTFIMDVTNVSTHKVQFVAGATDVRVGGATGDNATTVVFTRLGDT